MKTFLLILLCSLSARAATPAPETAPDSIYNLGSSWTNQDGKRIPISQLRGKPVVLAMVYTSCPVACPMTISEMKAIESAIPEAERSRVQFAVFSFDSERDTAHELKSYSIKRGLQAPTWTLMTGSPDDVRDLAAVLGLKYKRDAKGDFVHSNLITILDAQGVIRKQRSGFGGGPGEMTAELSRLLR